MVINGNSKPEQERAPVYIPFKTFLTAVETLEQGLPDPLDRSVWPSWSGGIQSQTLGAFKFLGLIDEKGHVQPSLHKLVDAKGEQRKIVLKEIIEEKYKEAVKLGEGNSTFQQLQDFFRQYGVESGTLERVIRFFLDACEYTGSKCSVHWAKAKKTIRRTSRRGESSGEGSDNPPPPTNPQQKDDSNDRPQRQLHPMLEGLITELPNPGTMLDSMKRESLKKYFDVILDIMYKKEDPK